MSNKISTKSPALVIKSIISQFDESLGINSPVTTSEIIRLARSKNLSLEEVLDSLPLETANRGYDRILDLTAETIATFQEETYLSEIKFPELPEIGHDNKDNLKKIIIFIVRVKIAIQSMIDEEALLDKKNQFFSAIEQKKKILNKGFFYEFTDADLDRIQQLVNELRHEIKTSDLFEENHRTRLLRRLEAMQSEMHKKMSDVDKIWGLVGDAGIVIGKFGKNAKPFVDRIKELSQIAWKTQARAEELPSSSQNPLLESDSD